MLLKSVTLVCFNYVQNNELTVLNFCFSQSWVNNSNHMQAINDTFLTTCNIYLKTFSLKISKQDGFLFPRITINQ